MILYNFAELAAGSIDTGSKKILMGARPKMIQLLHPQPQQSTDHVASAEACNLIVWWATRNVAYSTAMALYLRTYKYLRPIYYANMHNYVEEEAHCYIVQCRQIVCGQ